MTPEQQAYINQLINRAGSTNFEDIIKEGVKDNINDELTAMALYYVLAEKLKGLGVENVYNELVEHAKEEGTEHYHELLKFASIHGFIDEIKPELTSDIDYIVLNGVNDIVAKVQELETNARNKYESLAKLAEKEKAIRAREFFAELSKDEIEHFDDLAYINDDTRPIKESILKNILKSIKD